MFANVDIGRGEKLIIWREGYTDEVGAKEAREKGLSVMQWDDNLYSREGTGDDDGHSVNHSCDPNMWMYDACTLVAKRDIKQNEELTADYALWETNENSISKWDCRCGSPLCRGRVTGKDWRDSRLQERYRGHFSPLLNKRIQRSRQRDRPGR